MHILYPTETIKAHTGPVKVLKWTKSSTTLKTIKLISGSKNELEYTQAYIGYFLFWYLIFISF